MKRSTPLKRGKPLRAKTRMKQVSSKRRKHRASKEGQAEAAYMAAVKQLPCVITGKYGVDVHHCQSGRYGSRKASDYDVIPLAPEMHRHEYGPGAYHYNKAEWEALHGPDYAYVRQVQLQILGEVRDEKQRERG